MPRKKPEIKLVLHPSPESLNLTEEEIREKLRPPARFLARPAAREHWQRALEAQRAAKRDDASSNDEGNSPDEFPMKPKSPHG
jgi:hypothetical protein